MKNEATERGVSDQSPRTRKPKSREVSSRFLSPTSTTSWSETGVSSPNRALSPTKRKSGGSSARKHQTAGEELSLIRGLWPSSNSSSCSSKKLGTLADHLGKERLKDMIERKNNERLAKDGVLISRQRSDSDRFGKEREGSKENHRPIIGGSMRYTGKSSPLLPGRFSVDENLSNRKPSRRSSDSFSDVLSSESECSDAFSSTDMSSPAIGKNSSSSTLSSKPSSRRSGIKVSSRFMRDPLSKPRRATSESNISTPNITSENSQNPNSLSSKSLIGRASSMKVYGTVTSQWAMSPGRSGSPPMSVENRGRAVVSFSSLKPPSSPSKASKGVGNLLNLGLELFKSKRSSSSSSLSAQYGVGEEAHLLRLLHSRLLQWRYVNARALAVEASKKSQAESSLLNVWTTLSMLQSSVVQKHIQFNKEKLELKLNTILFSQVQPLEAWGDMERPHVSAVSMTKNCLHSVVCRVPLIEGAKVDPQMVSVALRHATDLTESMKTMLIDFSPAAQKTSSLLSELAEVVSREKSLSEECFDLVELLSALEMQERSLKCSIIQLKSHPQPCQPRQQEQEIVI